MEVGEYEKARLVLTRFEDEKGGGLRLEIEAPFHGDPVPDGPINSFWGLWEHEVVELFLVGRGEPVPYLVIQVGPYGRYLGLRLEGKRHYVEKHLPLIVTSERTQKAGYWTATVDVADQYIPSGPLMVNA
jgi:hypothetical protein